MTHATHHGGGAPASVGSVVVAAVKEELIAGTGLRMIPATVVATGRGRIALRGRLVKKKLQNIWPKKLRERYLFCFLDF
jgi:hypothetical protein